MNGTYYPGRYGTTTGANIAQSAGIMGQFDLQAQLKMQGMPAKFNQRARTSYGSLPDLRGRYGLGLNDFGQAIHESAYETSGRVFLDEGSPYELNLSASGARGTGTSLDNPFSLAELERVLRAYDLDSPTLPPRLYEFLKGNATTPNLNDLNNWRALLTTDSYDLPEPGFQMPEWVSDTAVVGVGNDYATIMGRPPVNATFADLVEYRLRVNGRL